MAVHSTERILLVAMELSNSKWRLLFSDGSNKSSRSIEARNLSAFLGALDKAKHKFKLEKDCRVVSGYEAGRDGFWIHRWLVSKGIDNRLMDAASIEVRRGKHKKTDRIDVEKLHELLERKIIFGQERAFSEVAVPSEDAESQMRICRERNTLVKERNKHTSRIKSLCVLHGITDSKVTVRSPSELRDWADRPLPPELVGELEHEQARLKLVTEQIREVEKLQRESVTKKESTAGEKAARLMELKSIGIQSAFLLSSEAFAWRKFKNRKKAGAFTGLTGTPYDSGDSVRDQGISKAGSKRVRTCMIELAWLWLRWQPDSALTKWYFEHYGPDSKRSRRKGIVALARKLFIALWKYMEFGKIPEGAIIKG